MKRRIATLAIVGAMAVAAMAPATVFASPNNNQTTVGYVPGGTAIDDIDALVIVPKDTMFASNGGTIAKFDVKAQVFDATNSKYIDITAANQLKKAITVDVASKNGGKLKAADSTTEATYTYYKDNNPSDGTTDEITFTAGDTYVNIGTIAVTTTDGLLKGGLIMGEANFTDADYGKTFSDVLTYQFSTDSGTTWVPGKV